MVFLPPIDAPLDDADGRVVEPKGIADLLQGARADTDQVDRVTVRSGTSGHGRPPFSKRGSGEVRKRLCEATLSAARHNASVRAIYRRPKKARKPDKVVPAAAACKLLAIAHAIYRSGEPFRGSEKPRT